MGKHTKRNAAAIGAVVGGAALLYLLWPRGAAAAGGKIASVDYIGDGSGTLSGTSRLISIPFLPKRLIIYSATGGWYGEWAVAPGGRKMLGFDKSDQAFFAGSEDFVGNAAYVTPTSVDVGMMQWWFARSVNSAGFNYTMLLYAD